MRTFLRWGGYLLAGVLALLVVAVGGLYARGSMLVSKAWQVAATDLPVPSDSAAIGRGHHLALTRGCLNCHREAGQGAVFIDEPRLARIVAPNIARLAREYSVADFDRVLRRGVRPDGRGLAIMPSSMFFNLSDEDVGALIAYLRTLTLTRDSLPSREIRLMARIGLGIGQFRLEPQLIERDHGGRRPPRSVAASETGEYIAKTSCSECHGMDLRGGGAGPDNRGPSLMVVASYTPEQFAHLMRTGAPTGGRKLGLMSEVATSRFSHFTDAEVTTLYSYLKTLPR